MQPSLCFVFTSTLIPLGMWDICVSLVTQALKELILTVTPWVPGFPWIRLLCWGGWLLCGSGALVAGRLALTLFTSLQHLASFISGPLPLDAAVQHLCRNTRVRQTTILNMAVFIYLLKRWRVDTLWEEQMGVVPLLENSEELNILKDCVELMCCAESRLLVYVKGPYF